MNDMGTRCFEEIDKRFQDIEKRLQEIRDNIDGLEDGIALEKYEQEVAVLTQRFGDLPVARKIQQTLLLPEMKEKEDAFLKGLPKRYHREGWREVTVRMTHGTPVKIAVRYASRAGVRNRRRERGLYPGLVLLGIDERCTPGLASEVAKLVVAMGSLEEAERYLRGKGEQVERKWMERIARRMAPRARLVQQAKAIPWDENIAGRQVVIATDGGRIRIRRRKRGRRTAKGRHGYHTPWKEPKLFVVHLVDGEGRQDHKFLPWIDGTLRGPDVLFDWLGTYLENLHITRADRILFIADGAAWIWNRVQTLIERLRLRAEQVVQAIDFYHVVEHLNTVAKEIKWNEKQRRHWVRTQRRALRRGRVGWVMDAIDRLCRHRGRNNELRRERNYFLNNRKRMGYSQLKAWHLPLGSGAVESAVRRVVNLRLKGAATFWNEDTAEDMLMLRAFYKAGRWNLLTKMAFSPAYVVAG